MTDEFASSPKPHIQPLTSVPVAIALVGFMGAGKTTVGRALATKLGWCFEDLDDRIQAHDGRTIEQIFHHSGEPAFRSLERQMLQEAIHSLNASAFVLSLGGGAFVDDKNLECLRESGIPAVFLDAPAEELFRRCEQPGVIRPLLRDRKYFLDLYQRRKPAYLKAAIRVETAGKEIAAIADEIISRLGLVKHPGASK
jgi:shikimate kinase